MALERLNFLVVTLEATLVTTELKFPSRIEVGKLLPQLPNYDRLGIAEEVAFESTWHSGGGINAVIHGNKPDDAKTVEPKLRNTPGSL